jgi:hypothetical protein
MAKTSSEYLGTVVAESKIITSLPNCYGLAIALEIDFVKPPCRNDL